MTRGARTLGWTLQGLGATVWAPLFWLAAEAAIAGRGTEALGWAMGGISLGFGLFGLGAAIRPREPTVQRPASREVAVDD